MTSKITTNPTMHSGSMNTTVSENGNNGLFLLLLLLMLLLLLHSFKTQETKEWTNEQVCVCAGMRGHRYCALPDWFPFCNKFCIFYFDNAHFLEVDLINNYFCTPNLFCTDLITTVNRHKSTTPSIGIHSASVFVRLLPPQSNTK